MPPSCVVCVCARTCQSAFFSWAHRESFGRLVGFFAAEEGGEAPAGEELSPDVLLDDVGGDVFVAKLLPIAETEKRFVLHSLFLFVRTTRETLGC